MVDVDKQMFESEASEHFAAQHKMWRHSEQQHADTTDYYFKMQELANDRLLLAEDESNIAASFEQRAEDSARACACLAGPPARTCRGCSRCTRYSARLVKGLC